ncbi:hypothetical protein AB6F55_15090 [Providencia hangzhouensis]
MIQSVALASNEQTHGVSQIHLAINELDSTTQANASMTRELQSSLKALESQYNYWKKLFLFSILSLKMGKN